MGNSRHMNFGFTLIELMVTLAVAAILVTIAIPGFRTVVMDNQLITQTNTLVSSLNLARSEAVKRGISVTICPSSNGAACTASNWKDGWIVFTDDGTAGAVDGTDQILLVQQQLGGSTTLSLNGGNFVRYEATGFLAGSCGDECGKYASFEEVADDPTATMTWGTRLAFALLPVREAHASGQGNSGHSNSGQGNAYAYGHGGSNDQDNSGDNDPGSNFGGNSDNDVLGTGNSGNGVGNTGTGNQGNDAAVGNAAGGSTTTTTTGGGGTTSGGGGTAATGGSTFTVCDSRAGETGRAINVSATGRVAAQRVNCN